MKSKRAKEFMVNNTRYAEMSYNVSYNACVKAVELAESEYRERAIKAFQFATIGLMVACTTLCPEKQCGINCQYVVRFLHELDNPKT